MRIRRLLVVSACLAALSYAAWSQDQSPIFNHRQLITPGRLGYLDPNTGAFLPLIQPIPEAGDQAPPVTPTTGKFVFTLNINIKSANIKSNAFDCIVTAGGADNVTAVYTSFTEEATVAATITGSTGKCTVTIPYSWPLVTPSADQVSLNWQVYSFSTTAGANGQPGRITQQTLPHITVPLNGSTTTYTIPVTM